MKRVLVVGVLLVVLTAFASAQMKFGGGPQFGLAFSSFKKPAGDLYGTGLMFGVHGDLDLNRYISIRLSFDYASFGADDAKLKGVFVNAAIQSAQQLLGRQLAQGDIQFINNAITGATGGGAKAPTLMISGLGKYPAGGGFTPYGILGFGMTFFSFSDLTVTVPQGLSAGGETIFKAGSTTQSVEGESKFGLQFGAGAEYAVARSIGVFLEFRYNMIFTSDGTASLIPIMIGATFRF